MFQCIYVISNSSWIQIGIWKNQSLDLIDNMHMKSVYEKYVPRAKIDWQHCKVEIFPPTKFYIFGKNISSSLKICHCNLIQSFTILVIHYWWHVCFCHFFKYQKYPNLKIMVWPILKAHYYFCTLASISKVYTFKK